jgi:hypothetical protein
MNLHNSGHCDKQLFFSSFFLFRFLQKEQKIMALREKRGEGKQNKVPFRDELSQMHEWW